MLALASAASVQNVGLGWLAQPRTRNRRRNPKRTNHERFQTCRLTCQRVRRPFRTSPPHLPKNRHGFQTLLKNLRQFRVAL